MAYRRSGGGHPRSGAEVKFDPTAWVAAQVPPSKGPPCSICCCPEAVAAVQVICEAWADGAPHIRWTTIAEDVLVKHYGFPVGLTGQGVERHLKRCNRPLWERVRARRQVAP